MPPLRATLLDGLGQLAQGRLHDGVHVGLCLGRGLAHVLRARGRGAGRGAREFVGGIVDRGDDDRHLVAQRLRHLRRARFERLLGLRSELAHLDVEARDLGAKIPGGAIQRSRDVWLGRGL